MAGFSIILISRYAGGLRTLGPIFRFEIHGLTFGQNLESIALNGRKMYKYVLATISRGDKAESLGFVEPFNSSVGHFNLPLIQNSEIRSIAYLKISKDRDTEMKSEKSLGLATNPVTRSYT